MSCSCVIDKLYPCVQFKDGHFEKIEDISMSCDGVFFTHHGIRYFYSDDCNKFYCTTFLSDFLESFKNDLSNEFLYIVYGPDIRSNAVEESKSSEVPCERCIHSYICKYKEDFKKAWKKLESAIACTKCLKGVL